MDQPSPRMEGFTLSKNAFWTARMVDSAINEMMCGVDPLNAIITESQDAVIADTIAQEMSE